MKKGKDVKLTSLPNDRIGVGETATRNLKFNGRLDYEVAVSPARPMVG